MAQASRQQTFNASIEKVYQVLADYESYPDFMDGVSKVEVLETSGNVSRVQYNINLIKKFEYSIEITASEPNEISWTFVEGDLFAKNNGKWELKDNGDGTTDVNYTLDLDFKVKVPGMIAKKLTSSNLPSMMKSVEKRAKSV